MITDFAISVQFSPVYMLYGRVACNAYVPSVLHLIILLDIKFFGKDEDQLGSTKYIMNACSRDSKNATFSRGKL